VIGLEGRDVTSFYHSQAEEIIKGAGRQLSMSVRRSGGGGGGGGPSYNGVQSPPQWQGGYGGPQSPPYGGSDRGGYVNEPGRSHLGAGDEGEDYSKSVGDIKKIFSKPAHYQTQTYAGIRHNASPGTTSYVPKRPVFFKPPAIGQVSDLGWVPKNKPYPHSQTRYGPSSMNSPPVNRRSQGASDLDFYHSQPAYFVQREPPEKPAWLGTLRSSGGPRMWEIHEQEALVGKGVVDRPGPTQQSQRPAVHAQSFPGVAPGGRVSPVVVHNPKVQTVRYGPGSDGPVYEQHDPSKVDSNSARVAHLQYNTPIGLYSKENAIEALKGQTRGKPGEGTMAITGVGGPSQAYNPSVQSDLHRLILEEESGRRGGGRQASGGRPVLHGGGDSGFSDF